VAKPKLLAADTTNAPDATPEDDVEMGFFDHLTELRKRVIRAMIGLFPGMIVAWMFKEHLLEYLLQPMIEAWVKLDLGQPNINFIDPTEIFVAYLKISIFAGAVASAPWFFWQVWGFIAPGLYRRERRMAIPFAFFSSTFFLGGVAFGYFIVFPLCFEFFLDFAGTLPSGQLDVRPMISAERYLSLAVRLLLAFGVVFEIPVVITFIAAAGMVTWQQLLKFSRWWVAISAVLAAFLTPPDIASQLMMLIPMVGLYFVSILLAFIFQRRREKKNDGVDNDDGVKYER
jgi:sec-independent protein translocase protein TatC